MKSKSLIETRQEAFLFFAHKIINGSEGCFFVLDRPEVSNEPIWVMGYGGKKCVKFDDPIFPKFCTTDFLGKENNIWQFKNTVDCLEWTVDCSLDINEKKNIIEVLENTSRIELRKDLYDYASETEASFMVKVRNIQQFEADGNAWVMNLTQNICGEQDFDLQNPKALLLSIYFKFIESELPHCGGVIITDEQKICSLSPEVFCKQEGDKISSYPIKGTGKKEVLGDSPKEIAELSMITDLLRNDFGQICKKVRVVDERVLTAENDFYHAHAVIEGELKGCLSWDQFQKILPVGSISGAPKKKVVEKILELENFNRKFYMGTFGVQFSPDFSVFNVLIRTLFLGKKHWYFPVGAGITVESDPKAEFEETFEKAKVFEEFCTESRGQYFPPRKPPLNKVKNHLGNP